MQNSELNWIREFLESRCERTRKSITEFPWHFHLERAKEKIIRVANTDGDENFPRLVSYFPVYSVLAKKLREFQRHIKYTELLKRIGFAIEWSREIHIKFCYLPIFHKKYPKHELWLHDWVHLADIKIFYNYNQFERIVSMFTWLVSNPYNQNIKLFPFFYHNYGFKKRRNALTNI